jgi:hypothetical protein
MLDLSEKHCICQVNMLRLRLLDLDTEARRHA